MNINCANAIGIGNEQGSRCKKMWTAVINNAIEDALLPSFCEKKIEARRWIANKDKDFQEVCLNAGLEPDQIYNYICNLLEKKQSPITQADKYEISQNIEKIKLLCTETDEDIKTSIRIQYYAHLNDPLYAFVHSKQMWWDLECIINKFACISPQYIVPALSTNNLKILDTARGTKFFANLDGIIQAFNFLKMSRRAQQFIVWLETEGFLQKENDIPIDKYFYTFLAKETPVHYTFTQHKMWWIYEELVAVFPILKQLENLIEDDNQITNFSKIVVSNTNLLSCLNNAIKFSVKKESKKELINVRLFFLRVLRAINQEKTITGDIYDSCFGLENYDAFFEKNPIQSVFYEGQTWWLRSYLIDTLKASMQGVSIHVNPHCRIKIPYKLAKTVNANPPTFGSIGINEEGINAIIEHTKRPEVRMRLAAAIERGKKGPHSTKSGEC